MEIKTTIRGVAAEVRWGYHKAADLGSWSLSQNTEGLQLLTATVTASDPFRLSQTPLRFVVKRQKGDWAWPVESSELTGDQWTATLGPPED